MAQKVKKWEEYLTVRGETARVVSYADYFTRRAVFTSLQIRNTAEEAATNLTLTLQNENGMLIPCEKTFEEIPFESVINVEIDNLLSPLYFSETDCVREEKIVATLKKDKKVVATAEWTLTTLPFDYWQGTDGDVELLAAFVRPKLADCAKVRADALEQLKKWNVSCELGGYVGNDKNTVRRMIAAVYASLRKLAVDKKEADISKPVEAGAGVKILAERKASALEMSLFAASCLESMGLHPVLVFGEKEIMIYCLRISLNSYMS